MTATHIRPDGPVIAGPNWSVGLHQFLVALVALAAALCYAASNVLEHRRAALAPPDVSMRIGLLWYLARQPIWWLAIGVDLGGFAFQALALGFGSLLFVQPVLVTSLLFSLIFGAMTGSHRSSLSELCWAASLAAALAIFLLIAAPSGGYDERPFRAWILPLLLLTLLVGTCVALSKRGPQAWRAVLLAAAAGTMFGVSSTLMKTFSHRLGDQGFVATVSTWEPYALGLVIALGFLTLQSAFQAGDLRAALPALEAAEPVIACVLGLSLMHERLHAQSGFAKLFIAVAVVVMVASVIKLARSAAEPPAAEPTTELATG